MYNHGCCGIISSGGRGVVMSPLLKYKDYIHQGVKCAESKTKNQVL